MITADVVVVGAHIAGFPTLDGELTSAVFDDDADAWTLTTRGGDECRSQIVIARSPLVPWIPDLPGRNEFRGLAFHAAAPGPGFDPTGKRIAVIGADAEAGRLIERITGRAAKLEVFAYAPRRVVGTTRRRRRRRPRISVTSEPIDSLTASGIRTRSGVHHEVDVIIYGTGFAVPDQLPALVGAGGITLPQAWRDGMEPYLGVAVHGFPNYFFVSGPDSERYVAACLQLMDGQSRIEVRRSSQQTFNERVYLHSPKPGAIASAFDVSNPRPDGTYRGAATLTVADTSRAVRVHLIGHVDPIDGQYHWQGTVFDPPDLLKPGRAVTLAIGNCSASARITEETPQGTHSIAGVGAPPFASQ
ncbi:putative monooxygenase [Mycobacterium tuberculosis H37Rv] [Mycobacterium shimoidei]|uniref:Putative monooxygenase [Mycobacterium tuberculosis H37Rv] n=1 Tax=Mycobacterium shimoidei TaxID=29313 RepID=A0A375YY58_MYCSH|nr:putative monooxygenase [Mycobacterium tuberculosis H37Rv] [Mycobacterium shimoidei]